MISIVAHGIMGTAYRQEVVVDGGISSGGSLQVLRNIRRQLSSQYGDDTPKTGWALVPAPDGMWLNHIERAFDANYAPAYVSVSFLIPHGLRLRPEAYKLIEKCLVANNAKYMQQSVVLYDADWSFLRVLGRELDAMVLSVPPTPATYRIASSNIIAYWPGDIHSMIVHIWDVRFRDYSIIYCGKRILASGKEYVRIDDRVVDTPELQPTFHTGTSTSDLLGDADNLQSNPISGDEVLRRFKENGNSLPHVSSPKVHEKTSRQVGRLKKIMFRILIAVSAVFAVFVVAFFGLSFFNDNNTFMYEEYPENGSETLIANIDSIYKDSIIESSKMLSTVENLPHNMMKKNTSLVRDSSSVDKTYLSSAKELFDSLTWDNVKNGGKAFYEKYEVEERLRPRVDRIIELAQEIGRPRYERVYSEVDNQKEEGRVKLYVFKLYLLEKEIRRWNQEKEHNTVRSMQETKPDL